MVIESSKYAICNANRAMVEKVERLIGNLSIFRRSWQPGSLDTTEGNQSHSNKSDAITSGCRFFEPAKGHLKNL
jgi:hypothetical protein